ncbi:MAG: 16S rRNA processing protein RimM [Clostridiales bacterium]|nr:16S rRNA processing protein RimM [Clostridiales bacterium]
MRPTHLAIGEITKPQGVRGEVKIRPITCDVDRFEGLEHVFLKRGDTFEPLNIRVNRIAADAVFANVEGVEDRSAAERLRGEMLYVDRANAVELDEDSNFLVDLIGLKGLTDDGRDLGVLRDVMQPGGNDVYVFRSRQYGEVLVPALVSVVESVDLDAGVMRLIGKRLDEVAVFDED